MSLKAGNFFSASHSKKVVADREEWHQSGTGRISGSSRHRPIINSPTDCCARAHFREPRNELPVTSLARLPVTSLSGGEPVYAQS